MFFFIKNKPIHLDCFTFRSELMNFPLQETSNFFPEWWKKLPKTFRINNHFFNEHNTMKRCAGFNSFFERGVTFPLWSDLRILIQNGEVSCQFSDRTTSVQGHPIEQRGDYLKESHLHLKIVSPWAVRCKEDLKWMFVQNTWLFDNPDDLVIPPGIIDFKYQSSVNINMFVMHKTRYKEIELKSGLPMINLIPLTENKRKVKIHTHLVDEIEFRGNQYPGNFAFLDTYLKNKASVKQKENTGKKCPFHF